jgi:hypothetical protein
MSIPFLAVVIAAYLGKYEVALTQPVKVGTCKYVLEKL